MPSSYNLFLLTLVTLALLSTCGVSAATTPAQAEKAIESAANYMFFTEDETHYQQINHAKNPVLKDKYKQCAILYTDAVNSLDDSYNILKSGNYQKVVDLAAAALEDVRSCDRIFTPPGTETKFKSLSEKSVGVAADLLALVKGLA